MRIASGSTRQAYGAPLVYFGLPSILAGMWLLIEADRNASVPRGEDYKMPAVLLVGGVIELIIGGWLVSSGHTMTTAAALDVCPALALDSPMAPPDR